MADEPFQPIADPFEDPKPQAGPPLAVVAQYLKDLSFESPRMPELLQSDVFVSAGDKAAPTMARVAIDAPQEVLVLRGDKKRNPPAHMRAR